MKLSEFRRLTQHLSDATLVIKTQDGSHLQISATEIGDVGVIIICNDALSIKEIQDDVPLPVEDSTSTCRRTTLHRR